MRFDHWHLGHREGGDVVVVNLFDNEANVRLLDNSNFQSYETGRRHRYYGGLITASPSEIPIPYNDIWHVLADMPGLDAESRIGIQIVPRAARQPLPRYQPPSLAPIAQAVAEIPPAAAFPAAHPTPVKNYHVFISHAAADKDEVVHPLTKALRERGLSVRHTDFALDTADRLRDKFEAAIAQSRFSIVVLSEHFFDSRRNSYELDRIVATHSIGKQDILPICHKLTKERVIAQRPQLADTIARSTTEFTIEEIAAEIADVIHDQKRRVATGP